MPALAREKYRIGWICALTIEELAAKAMLDEEHGIVRGRSQDTNIYLAGRIHDHNVVIACLPAGVDGLVAAATVGNHMTRTFTRLRFMLLVGIGGGIPYLPGGIDIRLGDVVVSQPDTTSGGVIQYDKGKSTDGSGFIRKGTLNAPPIGLLTAMKYLETVHKSHGSQMTRYLSAIPMRCPELPTEFYTYPGSRQDKLFVTAYSHSGVATSCDNCDETKEISRENRKKTTPQIHYGIIASGNVVVKDPVLRDNLRCTYNALCVEMEAAGLMNNFPSLVIRGICDYADSHKNDAWHGYAAVSAAAYTKELLLYVQTDEMCHEDNSQEVSDSYLEVLTESERRRREECLRAFKKNSYEEQKNINPDRAPDTCIWVLEDSTFRKWVQNNSNDLLWISAHPGCGKSVLAKSLIDKDLRPNGDHTLCYFFFKENEKQDSLALALRAILHQLFKSQQYLLHHAMPAWVENGDKLMQEVDEMWRIFITAASDEKSHSVTCVLDALDECKEADRYRLIKKLGEVYTVSSSSRHQSHWLKFLVTSRPYDDIEKRFSNALESSSMLLPTIRLRGEDETDQIRQEINSVIHTKVARLAEDIPLSGEMRHYLEQKLLSMEHRTYLWLSLAIDGIYEAFRDNLRPSEKLIEASIKSLPTSVEDAYQKILSRVKKQQEGVVKKILQIIVGARRPLSVGEMSLALGIATSERPTSTKEAAIDKDHLRKNIREWCGLFVFIDNSKIYLVHQTAREFLIHEPSTVVAHGSIWKNSLDLVETELALTRICVEGLCLVVTNARYLQTSFEELDDDHDATAFLVYAAEHWPSHLRGADFFEDDYLFDKTCKLYDSPYLFWWWWGEFYARVSHSAIFHNYRPASSKRLQIAAFSGHFPMLLRLLKTGAVDVNEMDSRGSTALFWASQQGHEKIVRVLLENGADPGMRVGSFGNALHVACLEGHSNIVQVLVDNGADINELVGTYGNALQAACGFGREEVAQILLRHGADVNAKGAEYGPALVLACCKGSDVIVKGLLAHGADVNLQEGQSDTPLQAAASAGFESIVSILLEHGADVNLMGGTFGFALQAACAGRSKKKEIVEILLRHGAHVNAKGGRHGTALRAACSEANAEIVQLLLDAGADIYPNGNTTFRRNSAFSAAISGQNFDILKLLMHRSGRWTDFDESLARRTTIVEGKWSRSFWRSLSSDLSEVKAIIDDLEIPDLKWQSHTIAELWIPSQRRRKSLDLSFLLDARAVKDQGEVEGEVVGEADSNFEDGSADAAAAADVDDDHLHRDKRLRH